MTFAEELQAEIYKTGFYPELVWDSVKAAIGQQDYLAFVLNHETTFDHDNLLRHLTVVTLTPNQLLVCHTDEHPATENNPVATALISTEAVRISRIKSVVIQKSVTSPETYPSTNSGLREIVITTSWGAVTRIDLSPAGCDDPNCDADHGFSGASVGDDLTIRVSKEADGEQRVLQAAHFAAELTKLTAVNH